MLLLVVILEVMGLIEAYLSRDSALSHSRTVNSNCMARCKDAAGMAAIGTENSLVAVQARVGVARQQAWPQLARNTVLWPSLVRQANQLLQVDLIVPVLPARHCSKVKAPFGQRRLMQRYAHSHPAHTP